MLGLARYFAIFSVITMLTVSVASAQTPTSTTQSLQDRLEEKRLELQNKIDEAKNEVDDKKDQILDLVKERLLAHIDDIIAHLENLKERLTSHTGINPVNQSAVLAKINSSIAELNNLKTQISSATTNAELKNVGETIRATWERIGHLRRGHVGIIIAGNFSDYFTRLQQSADKLETHLSDLAGEGKDVTDALSALADFQTAVSNAQAKLNTAIDIFNSITDSEQSEETFGQGMKIILEAKVELRRAVRELKSAILETKNIVADSQNY